MSLADGTPVGYVGELHPKVVAALGLPARTVGGELDLDALTAAAEETVQARTLVTFPMAQSDVALVVDEAVPSAAVEGALRSGAGETLSRSPCSTSTAATRWAPGASRSPTGSSSGRPTGP